MPQIANRVVPFGTTIFTEMNEIAAQHNAINLGQGKPDFDGPPLIVDAYAEALRSGQYNQYAPGAGIAILREAIAAHVARSYRLSIDPDAGVVITPGATEALFVSVMGLIDPGDEVIVIEPFFDSYVPDVLMAGGKPVYVPLRPPDWTLDVSELRAAFNERTRLLMLNSPHNPTGRVFSRQELEVIAELCLAHDVTVISDEVYEHLVYDAAQHIPIATLPGMAAQTITIGSAGKSFGMTGWKVGWAYGPPGLIRGVKQAHQFVAFAVNHPAQVAVARAFDLTEQFTQYRQQYARKRDLMLQGIEAAGMTARSPQGTYFVMADFSRIFAGDDLAFARYMVQAVGVAAIPPGAFFSEGNKALGQTHIRFSFAKTDTTLIEAAERLARLRPA